MITLFFIVAKKVELMPPKPVSSIRSEYKHFVYLYQLIFYKEQRPLCVDSVWLVMYDGVID